MINQRRAILFSIIRFSNSDVPTISSLDLYYRLSASVKRSEKGGLKTRAPMPILSSLRVVSLSNHEQCRTTRRQRQKIRNPNIESGPADRNKQAAKQIQNWRKFKTSNPNRVCLKFWDFGHLDLFRISNFELSSFDVTFVPSVVNSLLVHMVIRRRRRWFFLVEPIDVA